MGQSDRGGWFITRIGFELVVVTFLCASVGYYLDSLLKMRIFPALSLTGLMVGGGTGFWLVYREISQLVAEDTGQDAPRKTGEDSGDKGEDGKV